MPNLELLYTNGQTHVGRAYVYLGSPSGLSPSPAWTAESDVAGAFFGFSAGPAGDVNGDGYADVIVGAYYQYAPTQPGRVYVYHGSASGRSSAPAWMVTGDQANAFFGYSVGTAGDVNGDGYADVIVGALLLSNGQSNEGRVYVYTGSPSGLYSGPAWTAESDQAGTRVGNSVATAGDVNGDGYSDVIVGAPYYDSGQTDEGRALLYTTAAAHPVSP